MNIENQTENYKNKNVKIIQTLILLNCLPVNEKARFTSKNVTQYILGNRKKYYIKSNYLTDFSTELSKGIMCMRNKILHNYLPLSEQARLLSKNVTQYILGSRNEYNVFKFNKIKHLLYKCIIDIKKLTSNIATQYLLSNRKKYVELYNLINFIRFVDKNDCE